MRRAFTLQLYERQVSSRTGSPATVMPVGAERDERQEILFANLRRRVMVDKELPRFLIPAEGEFHLDRVFVNAWMKDVGMPDDTIFRGTKMHDCGCNRCCDAVEKKAPDVARTYHVHWMIGPMSVSLGLVTDQPFPTVHRDWNVPELRTVADYEYTMGMAIDDGLHECAMMSNQTDEELLECIRSLVEVWLTNRMSAMRGTTLHKVEPTISTLIRSRTTIQVAVQLNKNGFVTQITAERELQE